MYLEEGISLDKVRFVCVCAPVRLTVNCVCLLV